ncbi:MAG: DNA repair protein RecN [Candidatus Kapaibacterium sp.]
MLKKLQIKNFAIIREQDIEFTPGLNIITGETGSGKSILIDALIIALGGRASADFVRKGENKSVIECLFSMEGSHPVHRILEENELDSFADELIIRREISSRGISRAFVNDSPVQVSTLKELGGYLIDFHGQHDHQSLLRPESHIDILDSAFNSSELKKIIYDIFRQINSAIKELKNLKGKEILLREKAEFNRLKLKEIEEADPKAGEYDDLEHELSKLSNAEFLHSLTNELFNNLHYSDLSVNNRLSEAAGSLRTLYEIDSDFEVYIKELDSAIVSIKEVARFCKEYSDGIIFDPHRIEEIRVRLQKLKSLTKKYGSIDSAIELSESLKNDLSLMENFETQIKLIKDRIDNLSHSAGRIAFELSNARKAASIKLKETIQATLKQLGIENAVFETEFGNEKTDGISYDHPAALIDGKPYKLSGKGIDKIEFLISTNAGETPKPLTNVASGGEISRIMLALKSLIAERDNMPVMVFDEIDTGISGRIAQKAGQAMKKLAQKHQILAITHLPQIAALGDHNISVFKVEEEGKTYARSTVLRNAEKLNEIAKLIGGEDISEAVLKSARELTENT